MPCIFDVIEHTLITLADGRSLAARIWLPHSAAATPAPAVFEYLPYRKRDGTAPRDESTYPVFANAGYVGVRVDIAGTGESDGEFDDEYSARELADGVEIIAWIAAQDWCSGTVGMMGISWGGFNGLQIAALQPPALKAIISIGSTMDRYNDDIHYKNGCQLYANFSWSSVMLCFASRPPDPQLVGESWQQMWLDRLNSQPFPLEIWLQHQRRDDYWQHGSICEDYSAIKTPTLILSGWGDGYHNAPPTMAENSHALVHAINGPWIHKYPHIAWPQPRMDFPKQAIDWWDRWLKNVDNGVDQQPAYRAFIQQGVRPIGRREHEQGHWVAHQKWPDSAIERQPLFLGSQGQLADDSDDGDIIKICSPQDCGISCGEFFPLQPDSQMSGDQRIDDGGSILFETGALTSSVELLGQPEISLNIAIDKTIGNIAVRLIDVHPDGMSHRVSFGVLNLAHRHSNASPVAMQVGVSEVVKLKLNHCGYRFLQGHRIQVAISTAYWPMIMPPPDMVTATIKMDQHSVITLPKRTNNDSIEVPEPTLDSPLPVYQNHSPAQHRRTVEKDLQNGLTHYRVFDDTGEDEMPNHGLRTRHTHEECWSISPYDPLTSAAHSIYTCYMQRDNWRIRTVSESNLQCDAGHYYITAKISAYKGDELVNQREWQQTIKRDFT